MINCILENKRKNNDKMKKKGIQHKQMGKKRKKEIQYKIYTRIINNKSKTITVKIYISYI